MNRIVLRVWAFVVILIAGSVRAANGPDVADLWWNPSESGWGMQLVQSNQIVFATIFVYDAQGMPTWYTATLTFQGLDSSTSGPIFAGDLYETRGPWYGTTPFNTTQVQVAKVGTIRFYSPAVETGVLNYSVNGVAVSKNVVRQTLVNDNYNGTFGGTYVAETFNCANPANNGRNAFVTVFNVAQTSSTFNVSAAITLSSGLGARTCTFNGNYSQLGRMARSATNYVCTNGEAGSLTFLEMTRERIGILGRFIGTNNLGCSLRGSFAVLD